MPDTVDAQLRLRVQDRSRDAMLRLPNLCATSGGEDPAYDPNAPLSPVEALHWQPQPHHDVLRVSLQEHL